MDVLRDTDLIVSLLLVLNVTQVCSHDMTAIWLYIISLQLSMDRCPHLKDSTLQLLLFAGNFNRDQGFNDLENRLVYRAETYWKATVGKRVTAIAHGEPFLWIKDFSLQGCQFFNSTKLNLKCKQNSNPEESLISFLLPTITEYYMSTLALRLNLLWYRI